MPCKKEEPRNSVLGALTFWCPLTGGNCCKKKLVLRSYAPKPVDWPRLLEQMTLTVLK